MTYATSITMTIINDDNYDGDGDDDIDDDGFMTNKNFNAGIDPDASNPI